MTSMLPRQTILSLVEGGRMMVMRGDLGRLPASTPLVVLLFAIGVACCGLI